MHASLRLIFRMNKHFPHLGTNIVKLIEMSGNEFNSWKSERRIYIRRLE